VSRGYFLDGGAEDVTASAFFSANRRADVIGIRGGVRDDGLGGRAIAVAEFWKDVQDEAVYLPLVHPVLAYGTRGFEVAVDPENQPRLKSVPLKGP
jgi:hypothetical protein